MVSPLPLREGGGVKRHSFGGLTPPPNPLPQGEGESQFQRPLVLFATVHRASSAPAGIDPAGLGRYRSSQTSSIRQPLKMLLTMMVMFFTSGRQQVPPRR